MRVQFHTATVLENPVYENSHSVSGHSISVHHNHVFKECGADFERAKLQIQLTASRSLQLSLERGEDQVPIDCLTLEDVSLPSSLWVVVAAHVGPTKPNKVSVFGVSVADDRKHTVLATFLQRNTEAVDLLSRLKQQETAELFEKSLQACNAESQRFGLVMGQLERQVLANRQTLF